MKRFLLTTYPVGCMLADVKRRNIYLREDHLAKLKVLSEKTGARVSALIRMAIEEYLKKRKQ